MTSSTPISASDPTVLRRVRRLLDDERTALTGAHVLAMCSGGVDSVVLVDMLAHLSVGARPAQVSVLWCDHGLRDGTAARIAATAVARRHGFGLVERAAGSLLHAPGNVQGRARVWRYDVAASCARELGCDVVATGHTADDLAETLLMSLVSDVGRPFAGMRAVRTLGDDSANIVRPLLCVGRAEIVRWARERELSWEEDPSNTDRRFVRSAMRADVVPALARAHPNGLAALVRRSRRIANQNELIDGYADVLLAVATRDVNDVDGRVLDVRIVGSLSGAARRDLLARWLRRCGCGRDLSDRTVEAIDRAVVDAGAGRRVDVPGGTVSRFGYDLRLSRSDRSESP